MTLSEAKKGDPVSLLYRRRFRRNGQRQAEWRFAQLGQIESTSPARIYAFGARFDRGGLCINAYGDNKMIRIPTAEDVAEWEKLQAEIRARDAEKARVEAVKREPEVIGLYQMIGHLWEIESDPDALLALGKAIGNETLADWNHRIRMAKQKISGAAGAEGQNRMAGLNPADAQTH